MATCTTKVVVTDPGGEVVGVTELRDGELDTNIVHLDRRHHEQLPDDQARAALAADRLGAGEVGTRSRE